MDLQSAKQPKAAGTQLPTEKPEVVEKHTIAPISEKE